MEQAILIMVAAVAGVVIAVQAQLMGLMDRGIGTVESVFITYMGGGILIGLILLGLRGGNLAAWQGVPRYALLAGVCGLFIVGSIGYTVPRLGMVAAFSVIVSVQFIFGAFVDHFGLLGADLRPMDLGRLVGIPCLLLGTWLILR